MIERLKALMYSLPIVRILRHSRHELCEMTCQLQELNQRAAENERRVQHLEQEFDRRNQRIDDEYNVLRREADTK